jgi:hypothetical protein
MAVMWIKEGLSTEILTGWEMPNFLFEISRGFPLFGIKIKQFHARVTSKFSKNRQSALQRPTS